MNKEELTEKFADLQRSWTNEEISLNEQIENLTRKRSEAVILRSRCIVAIQHIEKMDDEGNICFTVPTWFKEAIEYCTAHELLYDHFRAYQYFIGKNLLEDVEWEFCDDERESKYNDVGNTSYAQPVVTAKIKFQGSRYENISCD